MYKQLLNLGLLLLLVTGCKLSAFTSNSEQNSNSVPSANTAEVTFNSANNSANMEINSADSSQKEPSATALQQANAVCANPSKPCHHKSKKFDDWELSFKMPAKLTPNKPYKSAPFYAVILKTYKMDDDCDGGEYIEAVESDRKKEQANQLERKVFAEYQCPNMAAVNYDFEGKWDAAKENMLISNFIAIYAGATKAEAEKTLQFMKGEYPDAILKQMTASYEIIEQ